MSGKRLTYEKPAIIEFRDRNAWGACAPGAGDRGCANGSGDASGCNTGKTAGSCTQGKQAVYSCKPTGNSASWGCDFGNGAALACPNGSSRK